MKTIKPSYEIIAFTPDMEKTIELAGRTCYKSEDKITDDSAEKFVSKIRSLNHESVLEHGSISVHFVCDRGVSHELVRHRLTAVSQESQRYCNYSKDKFDNQITVIDPCGLTYEMYATWRKACLDAEASYFNLLAQGVSAQMARAVLPNSTKTELVMTANPREWRHIIKMRTGVAAHPQMREIMITLAVEFADRWPALF